MDAFAKWLEVRVLKNTTSKSVISSLRHIFSIHGLIDLSSSQIMLHTSQSQALEEYFNKGGMKNITSDPFYPSSNGQAKRMVHLIQEDADKHFEKIPKFQTDGQVYAKNYSSGKPCRYQLRKRYVTAEENHSAKKIESQKKTTREETETVEAIPEENAAIVTTSREETDADRANNSIPPGNEALERGSYRMPKSEKKGNPPFNSGPSPFSDECANSAVEEVNEPTPGSGSLQLHKASGGLSIIRKHCSIMASSMLPIMQMNFVSRGDMGWYILCLHALEPKCKALNPAWRDSDGCRNM
ncbi:hypothetical protein T07_8196 [Trichinella nelsoni]|uniref:Integrase catalytic domain-containing protein n=1 Tax=Trichinella nelsoni TaxID=6336 RepID=A0A0V0RMP4_9BILA|nr:hypothetical protein T07_8196 [Trichinella nelsoni]